MDYGQITDPGGAEAEYARLFPYHAELIALTGLRKKRGAGVKVHSGIGGHCLLYLSGVKRDRAAGYPVLQVVPPDAAPARNVAAISVNAHYRNANWVAADGVDFIFQGALAPGEALTRDGYERTQAQAKALGVLDGVEFHEHLFRDKPAWMSELDYMYEISIASDYAVSFARDIFRARIPLDHARMAAIVDYLNDLNAPYRAGAKIFRWRVFNNNCVHIVHNALTAAGVWPAWPTGQPVLTAAFNFPVPKNEFVDLMRWTNDLPLGAPDALYRNAFARQALLETGTLPAGPGSIAIAGSAIRGNDFYDIEKLRLIFYENPFWGPYRRDFNRMLRTPRYLDLRENLRHFAGVYAAALNQRGGGFSGDRKRFQLRYEPYIEAAAARINRQLASLDLPAEQLEAVP